MAGLNVRLAEIKLLAKVLKLCHYQCNDTVPNAKMTNDIRPKKPRSVQLVQFHVEKEFMDLALLVINDTFFVLVEAA